MLDKCHDPQLSYVFARVVCLFSYGISRAEFSFWKRYLKYQRAAASAAPPTDVSATVCNGALVTRGSAAGAARMTWLGGGAAVW